MPRVARWGAHASVAFLLGQRSRGSCGFVVFLFFGAKENKQRQKQNAGILRSAHNDASLEISCGGNGFCASCRRSRPGIHSEGSTRLHKRRRGGGGPWWRSRRRSSRSLRGLQRGFDGLQGCVLLSDLASSLEGEAEANQEDAPHGPSAEVPKEGG